MADETITTETINGEIELLANAIDATGIARPGDVLVFSYDGKVTPDQVAEFREGLKERLPGLRDIVVQPFKLEAIYRAEQ